jgi:hypothetical protein
MIERREEWFERIEELMILILEEMKTLLEVMDELRSVAAGNPSSRQEEDPSASDIGEPEGGAGISEDREEDAPGDEKPDP